MAAAEPLEGLDVVRIRADNPGLLSLDGTNTWVVGRDPAYVVDPGPGLPAHVKAVAAEVARRGGLGAIALTHRHVDHVEGLPALLDAIGPAPVAAAAGEADVRLGDGDELGPLLAIPTPGHAPDHLAFVAGPACFTGDAVLGAGSVTIVPHPGSLAGYLGALRRLRALPLDVLCPGHGPPVRDPQAKLDEYIAHRLDRERRLVDALAAGRRRVDELLDEVWDDVPPGLRPAAAVTLRTHLDKLADEGRLPADVELPEVPAGLLGGDYY